MGRLFSKLGALAKLRRQKKQNDFDIQELSYEQAKSKFAQIFEDKIEEIKEEVEAVPEKYSKIKDKTKSKHGRELRHIEHEKSRELRRLSKEEKYIKNRIDYIELGGTQTTFVIFKSLDDRLKRRFSWYEKWHLNPLSAKVNFFSAGIYSLAFLFIITFFAQIPKVSDAGGLISMKSANVAQINVKNSEAMPSLDKSAEPQKSISVDNVTVNFSDQAKTASTEIAANTGNANETKAVKFTLLQSENAQTVSKVDEKRSVWQKIAGIFGAKAQEENVAIKEDKVATGVEVLSSDKNNSVTYKVNENLDLAYEIKKDGGKAEIKETAIIKDKAALSLDQDYQLSFKMDLSGLFVKANSDGSYDLVNPSDGSVVMNIAAPTIFDADKKAGNIGLVIDSGSNLATYKIDPSFVDQAKYPLYLDPTVTITTSTTTNPSSYSKDHTLFEATNGSMINVYSDGTGLYYTISSNHGNTWGAGTKILDTTTADDTGFSGWITADNSIHLVYSNNNTNSYIFYRKLTFATASNTITSIGTEYTVESAGTSQAFPSVAVKTDGTIFVAYRYFDSANYTIKVKPSTATDGSTWGAAATVSSGTNASASTYPELTLWNGSPAVVYNFANGSLRWNYYSGSAWQTAGWTYENISNEIDADMGLEFSVSQPTSDNFLHLAWRGSGTNGILYRKLASASDPSTWDSTSAAITASHSDRYPNLGLGLNSAVYLYYSEYVGANSYNIKYAEKVGNVAFGSTKVPVTTDNANNLISQTALKPTLISIGGISNYAMTFSGAQAISAPNAASLNISGAFSASMWVKHIANTGTFETLLAKRGTNCNYEVYLTTGTKKLGFYNGGTVTVSNIVLPLGQWHYITVVVNAGITTYYYDGNYDSQTAGGVGTVGTDPLSIGTWGSEYFNGSLDEIQLYNRALTTTEITSLFNNGVVNRQSPNTTGLMAQYHFDENTGTAVGDSSANGNNASFSVGTPTWVSAPNQGIAYSPSSVNTYAPVVFVTGTGSPYNINYAPTVKVWSAAADGNWETAGNWTPSGAPAAGDMVIFDSTSVKNSTVATYTSGNGIVDQLGGLNVSSSYSGTITFQKKPSQNADPYKINVLGDFVVNGGTVVSEGDTTTQHNGVTDGRGNEYDSNNLILGTAAKFQADAKGFTSAGGPTADGGYGGPPSWGNMETYGDYSNPVSLGSGGHSDRGGYPGGGAITIVSSNTTNILGTLSVNGNGTVSSGGAGGSGGTVNISAKNISGTGTVSANGGGSGSCYDQSGGGGRVKLAADAIDYSGSLQAYGGNCPVGYPGTIYKKLTSQNYGDLIIDNGTNVNGATQHDGARLNSLTDSGSYRFDNITFRNYGKLLVAPSQTFNATTTTITGDKNSGFVNSGTMSFPANWTIGYFFSDKAGTVTGLSTKNITISSTGRLSHSPNPAGVSEPYKINWSVASLDLQASGEINVDSVGFPANNGPGHPGGGSTGASYGGEGYGSPPTSVYGDYSNPVNLGSGSSSSYSVPGGGAVILNVANTLTISGTISANGTDSSYGGGSSGGSVNLTAATINNPSGGGVINAKGGGSPNGYSGGGGGRIKLSGNTVPFNGVLSAAGGNSGSGSAGTIYKIATGSQSYGDLILDNGANTPNTANQLTAHLKSSTDNGSYQFDSITCRNYGRLAVDASQTLSLDSGSITGDANSGFVNAGTVTTPASWTIGYFFSDKAGTVTSLATKSIIISSTGLLTHYPNPAGTSEVYKLSWSVASLNVQTSGQINANYVGFPTRNGPGKSTDGGVGASYGGEGVNAALSTVYGDYSNPVNLGSGATGGPGGGAIILNVTNTLTVSGTISAIGATGSYQSGGSGGSINLTAATINGTTGTISANGGGTNYNGSGSGGRVKLTATGLNFSGSITAKGSTEGYGGGVSAAGTIFKKVIGQQTYGSLIIDNTGNTGGNAFYTPINLPLSFDVLTVQNYGKLMAVVNADPAQNTLAVGGDLTVASNGELNLIGDIDGTPSSGAWPAVTVGGNASVTGTITSTGRGFVHDTGVSSGKGLVAGGNGSGGGYGGSGGNSAGGAVGGQTYGDQRNNNYLGSGGGNTNGGAGGGMVKLAIAGNLGLSTTGTISSNGNAGGANGGGGSGGSVQIVTGGALSGSGSAKITANGGNGGSAGGGGGGGRVTIYSASDSYTGTYVANGGALGSGAQVGSAGTIFAQHSPTAPAITSPNNGATGQAQRVAFHFNSTDSDTDWVQYKFQLATDAGISQNVSTFDETVSQTPTDGGRSAAFSNQNMTTGKVAGSDGYSSGRDAILTMTSDLTQGATYYYRVYAYDPEGVDSFDGSQHWSVASTIQSFAVAAIDHIAFSSAQQEIVVTFCSAEMTVKLRNSSNADMNLTSVDGDKTVHLASTSSGGKFYSDGNCQSEISGANLTVSVGTSSSSFYYEDTVPSAVGGYWNITAAENPSLGWTDGSQNIRINAGDFGSFEITNAPTTLVAGQTFLPPANDVMVTVKDIFGNVKNDWVGQIWFYSSDSQGIFPYTDVSKYTFTSGVGLDNGTHTFAGSGFSLKTKGNQSLVVHNSEGSEHDAMTNVLVSPAATDHFGMSSYPKTSLGNFAMASFAWNTPGYSAAPYTPAVTVYDQYNNIKDNFTGGVWFELYKSGDTPGNPNDSNASYTFNNDYTNPYTFTSGGGNDNGAHSFAGSGYIVNSAGSDLRFRVKTLDNGGKYTDFTINVKPQAIDHFGITTSPTLSRNGTNWEKAVDTAFTEDVTLTAYDAFGNVKTDYGYDAGTKAGMVYFYSSDSRAVLPYYKTVSTDSSHCYNFPADNTGTYTFTTSNTPTNYYKFHTGGYQTISASECVDPTSDYATNVNTNRYDPRLEGNNPLKLAASTGDLPASNATPSKVFVSQHVPGSNHTATVHTNDANDLISAAPGHQQANLSWYNPFDVPANSGIHPQVYIYRCTLTDCGNPANFSKIVTSPAEVGVTPSTWGSYTDTGLTNGQDYFYRLSYAYQKQDDTYLESGFSNIVTVQPADIAPREITAIQLDVSDPSNPGKVQIDYKLRWNSNISIAYFDPDSNSWHDASAPAMSGDVGVGVTGSVDLDSHTAYLDPAVDFGGKYLEDSFKIRVKAQVNGNNAYSDSGTLDLDSKDPLSTLVVDATVGTTANLSITGSDDTGPLMMMVAKTAGYGGASWESFGTSKNNFDIGGATNIYLKVRDNFNNITEVITSITGAPSGIQIKDASDIVSGDFRLTIIWHAVAGSAHYNILRTTDGNTYVKIAEATENGYLNMNLDQATTYGYKVTAVDASGNISQPAGPVSSAPGSAPDVTAPPQTEIFGWKQDVGVRVNVTWHTDQLSDSFVAYSKEELSAGAALTTTTGATDKVMVVGSPDLKTDHAIMLYNLDPSTKYYFKVLSKNQIQITGFSSVLDFTTPERILLNISGLKISEITNIGGLVSWTTSKLSTTRLEYGKNVYYESSIIDDTLNTDHKFQLKDLTAGEYHLRVNATDSDGNVTISDDYTFDVPATPAISNVAVSEVGDNGATISWDTNVPCDSNVDFVSSEKVSGSQGDGSRVSSHKVKLIGLDSKTTYSIKARSIDQFGNIATSGEQSFTTTADTMAPIITNQKSEVSSTGSGNATKYQLIVLWETNEPATSKVEYAAGMGENYDSASKEDLSLNMTHVVIISDLKPNSLFHFRIKSMDKAGNTAYSDDYTITTPPKEKNILTIIINAIVGPINDIYTRFLQKFKLR